MPTVLVVDDSQVDRHLVSSHLRGEATMDVMFAGDGVEALSQMEQCLPDVVITDVMMPRMDGLQLVSNIRRLYPLVPVILMTSVGNEDIAARALREGAASYVPKHQIDDELKDTLGVVLAAAEKRQSHTRVMECMTKNHVFFSLENDPILIPALVGYLQDSATYMCLCDEADRTRIGVALEEALSNSIYHGNLEVSSQLRESDDHRYHDLIAARRHEPPYCKRRIKVEASISSERAEFVIEDEGAGFNVENLPDPTDPANLDQVSGRGVLLMRTFMDEVQFNEKGNRVRLVKLSSRSPAC